MELKEIGCVVMNLIDQAADGVQHHSCVNMGNESPALLNGRDCCLSPAVALIRAMIV
jgi:hypothetical protein